MSTVHSTSLPAHPTSAAEARAFVGVALSDTALDGDQAAVVTLLVSELVTNAFVHGRAPIHLRVDVDANSHGTRVRVEVEDGEERTPEVTDADGYAESGRGMLLVDVLSDRWGVEERPGHGKAVWFEFPPSAGGALDVPAARL